MIKYKSSQFQGQRVMVDGATFEDCTFRDCVMVYRGGPSPVMDHCTFDDSTRWAFEEAAGRTVALLKGIYQTDAGGKALVLETLEA
jgi:hypothetical protein